MRISSISVFFVAAVALLIGAGCGGSGGGSSTAGGGGSLAGNYEGSVNLPSGRVGLVTMSVGAGGATEGKLSVFQSAAMSAHADFDPFQPGLHTILGHCDSKAIDLDDAAGHFTVSGKLPSSASGSGTLTIKAGASTYDGTVKHASASTASANITLKEPSQDANVHVKAFPQQEFKVSVYAEGSDIRVDGFDKFDEITRSISMGVPASMLVGDTFTFTPSHTLLTLQENTGLLEGNVWNATAGTMTLVSKSLGKMSLSFKDVKMEPVTIFGAGTGSFTLNGTLQN
ncbi:MAG TPA: hypothetical protein VG944_09240 [Fimbriimonas sp.]|nr:hypothetical protein [Fimbriimonas sp.]